MISPDGMARPRGESGYAWAQTEAISRNCKSAPITFDTLFKTGTKPQQVLDPIVQREMDKRWQGYGGPAPVNNLGVKVYQNFAITDDAVIFFIGQGEWLAEVAGRQEVSVPSTELPSLMV